MNQSKAKGESREEREANVGVVAVGNREALDEDVLGGTEDDDPLVVPVVLLEVLFLASILPLGLQPGERSGLQAEVEWRTARQRQD